MKTFIHALLVATTTATAGAAPGLESIAFDDPEVLNQCVWNLQSIGVGTGDAYRECNAAGFNAGAMSNCAVALFQRGVRGDHAVRECQAQGSRAWQFANCVVARVNYGQRTDLAVRDCR